MLKIFPIVVIILVAALSGCIGSESAENDPMFVPQVFERTNPNLNAKIVDLKLLPEDVRAGEAVTADLMIANTGTENINNETIYIKAKVKTLDDFIANLALKAISDKMKTREYTMDFKEEIEPGTIKPISAVFKTVKELNGKNLAGKYNVMVILSVNGEKVDSKVIQISLRSGEPREQNEIQSSAATTPEIAVTNAPSANSTPIVTETPIPTPTPEPTPVPTPEEVTVEPTGKILPTNIMNYRFGEPKKIIEAGDAVQWKNSDDDTMTLVETNGKISNLTVSWRTTYTFNTTGTYVFELYYPKMRVSPPVQTIEVKLNESI
jgi:hypothetical protein